MVSGGVWRFAEIYVLTLTILVCPFPIWSTHHPDPDPHETGQLRSREGRRGAFPSLEHVLENGSEPLAPFAGPKAPNPSVSIAKVMARMLVAFRTD